MRSESCRESPYQTGLDRNRANFVPLTPLTFLERAASIHPDGVAVVHGPVRRSWRETYQRCRRLASALSRVGVGAGDTVAVMGANTPETLELHYGVPMSGAAINAINTRLDPATVAYILQHSESRVLFTDREFSRAVAPALESLEEPPLVIDIDDRSVERGELLGAMDHEAFLATGEPDFAPLAPEDEWQAIALNYTSGTTGMPKGVVYHHRGAYLNAVSNAFIADMGAGARGRPVYLWTLPMFHCNGWCFPWTIALVGGTHVCLRVVRVEPIFEAIRAENVTHLCGAPPVLQTIGQAPEGVETGVAHRVVVITGGAPPSPASIEAVERRGFDVTHGYGLTESYGAAAICAWQPAWDELAPEERARLKARQGVRTPMLDELMVADPGTLEPVPRDGHALGEVLLRGNVVMKGYFKNPEATRECFEGGWFHSGDLAVWHPDGYIEIKDRSKDIIISGGEKISSVEVESVLHRHPAVLEAAVVAMPDPKWGESPCAFIALRSEHEVEERDIISYCRQHLAHYKVPKSIVYGPVPKTATGKVQKNLLRARARTLALLI